MMPDQYRVLVVDDDEDDRLLIRGYFEELDVSRRMHVDCVESFAAAVAHMTAESYDLAFFDYRLGAQTGLELLEAVRAKGVRTPVVFLTGQGGEDVAAEVIKAGATDYLAKSKLTTATLLQKTQYALDFRRAELQRIAQEERLTKLERQLRQAQKMEAIGHLAGGIAHDFNNLLMVITSHAEAIERKLPDVSALPQTLESILGACEKCSRLTEQLLAFSRQQVLDPKVFDLNDEIRKMHSILKPVLGEDLDLRVELDEKLWRIKADPGQVEQVILNLAVNARDAMPRGGKLTIATFNCVADEEYIANLVGMKTGEYVALTVADSGEGMDAATRARIFEPFFTTKEVGKGTGLGLATVYGIVQQSGGYIAVESEPGQGTKFTAYLLRTDEQLEQPVVQAKKKSVPAGKRVLLVEDVKDLLCTLRDLLQANGYQVLCADNGRTALELLRSHEVDLLITDIVMPTMGGDDLAESVRVLRPKVKILFMSGGTLRLVSDVKLPAGTRLLHKPFTGKVFLEKIEQLISERSLAQAG